MDHKVVYQTIEDRGSDLDRIELNGPILCQDKYSWLGDGYYFWDTFIENAHWWGKDIKEYPNGYIICKAYCDKDSKNCLDLVGNTEHLLNFRQTVESLKQKGLVKSNTTVKRVIDFLKKTGSFNYEATRVYGIRSKSFISEFSMNMFFDSSKNSFLDLTPPIQICFYKKKGLNLRNYAIEFPEEYKSDYLV